MRARDPLYFALVALAILGHTAAAQSTNLWRPFRTADGLAEDACISVTRGAGGNVILRHARSSAITILDGYEARTLAGPSTKNRVHESSGGQLWTPTSDGLAEWREGKWVSHFVSELAAHFGEKAASEVPLLPVLQGRVLVLLPDRLLRVDIEEMDQPQVTILRLANKTRLGAFTAMNSALDGGLWISGAQGLAKLAGPLRSVKPDASWTEHVPPADMTLRNFRAVQEKAPGTLAVLAENIAGETLLASFNGQEWSIYPLRTDGIRFAWRRGNAIWAATGEALYELKEGSSTMAATEEISVRRIFDIAVEPGGDAWMATSDGLFRKASAIWTPAEAADAPDGLRQHGTRIDGKTLDLRKVLGNAATPGGLPGLQASLDSNETVAGAEWKAFLNAKNGDTWLGGVNHIAWHHQNAWRVFASTNQVGPEHVLAFAESPEGRIWCATPGKVWEFDANYWLVLRGGFDNIRALHCTSDGTLWVATDNGLHRYARGAWIANGTEDGLSSAAVRALFEDDRGALWADTAGGPCRFTPHADPDPPRTMVRTQPGDGHEFRENTSVSFTFDGRDKWNVTTRERLLFSYRLDEREWTPFQDQREFSFLDLPLGKHYFQVRAMDRNGNIDSKPARYEFAVVVPWYRETRLVLILSVALAIAVFFAALAMNRHRRLLLSYAEVERKIAERTRELELANRELLHSQKMNALGTLAAGIAHDFNNILSIIKGSAQIIEDNPGHPEKIRTRLERIKTVVQQGAGIVEAMLGFSRSSEQQSGPCALRPVVEDTVKLLGDRFLKEVEVRVDGGEGLREIVIARDFVQQILLNFIFNAAEAMSGSKQINITIRKLTTPPLAAVLPPAPAKAYAAIAVRDIGGGITPENLPRVFEPFFTTKSMSARRGTGLGLSMAYELAKKMEAGLAVESTVGIGSTFTLILPIKET